MHIAKDRLTKLISESEQIAFTLESILHLKGKALFNNDFPIYCAVCKQTERYRETIRLAQEALDASPPWET